MAEAQHGQTNDRRCRRLPGQLAFALQACVLISLHRSPPPHSRLPAAYTRYRGFLTWVSSRAVASLAVRRFSRRHLLPRDWLCMV